MNRNILVTGASSGIGKTLVQLLAQRGDRVWALARRAEELESLTRQCASGAVFCRPCDVTHPDQVQAAFQEMQQQQFLPEVAVLNAGINRHDLLPQFKAEEYRQIFETNLLGALVWVETLLPKFLARGSGQFIAISSLSAFLTHSRGAGYSASKAALTSTFQAFQKRYAKEGVLFTTVHLGPIDTQMWNGGRHFFVKSQEQAARQILRGIDRRKVLIDYPWALVWMARLTQLFPGLPLGAHRP